MNQPATDRDAPDLSQRARRDPRERVAPYRLSPELEALALQIARLSRLPKALRADIAETAASEIRALLDARIPPGDIPARLGPPAQVAARLRRDRQSRRRAVFRILSGWKSALLATVAFLVLVYTGMLIWFHTAKPRISRNFSAEFNAQVAATPGERAAPLYLEAIAAMDDMPDDLKPIGLSDVRPGDAPWPAAVSYLSSVDSPLAVVRRAAAMPLLGLPLTDAVDPRWSMSKEARQSAASAGTENPMMVGVMLPQLGVMRALARMLAGDALAAAERKDPERAVADLRALLGSARHAGESRFLICGLVEVAMNQLAAGRLGLLIEKYPGLFTDAQLESLAQAFAACRAGGDAIQFEGERTFFHDMVQRVYTDNGAGDGRLCAAGLRLWHQYSGSAGAGAAGTGLTPAEWAFGPVIAYTSASRKEMVEMYTRCIDSVEQTKARPRYARARSAGADSGIEQLTADPTKARKFEMLVTLMPALGQAAQSGENMAEARDGALTVIALERYRLANGRMPDRLDDLVPRFLAAVPVDPFDGRPMRYRVSNGAPVLYTVGSDLDDDGGRPPAGKNGNDSSLRWRGAANAASAPDGDHILWPKPREPVE